jgi:hypothetical protein
MSPRTHLLSLLLPLLALANPRDFRPDPHKKDLVILYKDDDFKGGSVTLEGDTPSLVTVNMNDEASSFKVRIGYSVIFYEDTNYKGEWFSFNCPPPIGIAQSEFCEIDSLGNDITTTSWCFLRSDNYRGCLHWWNDRVSSVQIRPADMSEPQQILDHGHVD